MAANLGKKKTGGRQKGTPNKRVVYSVHARLKDLGVDLIQDILKDIQEMTHPYDRAKCRLQLLEYCDAKRKSIDMATAELDPEVEKIKNMSTPQLVEMVKENIAKVG